MIMGPMDLTSKDKKTFLNMVNISGLVFSFGTLAKEVIKTGFGLGQPVI